MTRRTRWISRVGLMGTVLTLGLTACGGGTYAAPPPPPPPAAGRGPAQVTPGAPMVKTDEEPQKRADVRLFNVDLDTVKAGRFDQGKMWTFEFPPTDYFAETYGFRPDSSWYARARLGALRIPSCSASFVSPHGLVLTNHHCAREFVTQVQKEGESLLDNGFYARDLADERAVEGFHADRLMEIVDVTDEVTQRLDSLDKKERAGARDGIVKKIQKRILEERGGEDAGLLVEMVSLYNGALTHAYVFRRYTNVKLVAAPELQIGFFGGDPDNFTYPRYNLDFSFFRVYDDDGNPLESDPYFKVSTDSLTEGEPIFIVGNPGSTSRLQTVAELEFRRDVSDRYVLDLLRSRMKILDAYIEAHPKEAEALDLRNEYFGMSNSEKAYTGQIRGLEDPVIMTRRADTERSFQEAIDADPELRKQDKDLISSMADLQDQKRMEDKGFGAFLALSANFMSSATLHRALLAFQYLNVANGGAPPEVVKGLMDDIKSVRQIPAALDEALMVARFHDFIRFYGADSDLVRRVLGGRSPEEVATSVRELSALSDSAQAVWMLEQGTLTMSDAALGVVRSYLPAFIGFQRSVNPVLSKEKALAEELGRARFKIYGTDLPPDATFSLRIADGKVEGYDYNGTRAPFKTTFYGLYDRYYSHAGKEDWALPDRWLQPPETFDLATPLDFVSTADIIGGNSGSPVLNKDLEIVGVVFDGNIESLPGDYIYLPEFNRSVAVDIHAVLEALDDVYDMDRLVVELTEGRLVKTEAQADAGR